MAETCWRLRWPEAPRRASSQASRFNSAIVHQTGKALIDSYETSITILAEWISSKSREKQKPRSVDRGFFWVAEKGGFEPPRPLFGPAPLAGVCIRPLCHFSAQILCGAAGRIRTHDPLVRSQILYPTELQPRKRELNSILGVCILSRVYEQKIYSLHLSLREAKKVTKFAGNTP